MFQSNWITHPDSVFSENRIYLFRKKFTLTEKTAKASLNISAEARYKLRVNGVRVAFGPCRSSGEEKYSRASKNFAFEEMPICLSQRRYKTLCIILPPFHFTYIFYKVQQKIRFVKKNFLFIQEFLFSK